MIDRLRACADAIVDTLRGESAHYALHVADARNTTLHNRLHHMRERLNEALARAEHAEGEVARLEAENAQQREWLRLDELERIWEES